MIKPVSNDLPFFWILLIRSFGGYISMVCYGVLLKKPLKISHVLTAKGGSWLILGTFIGQYLSMMVWVAGYKYTSASIASILNETASIFILILSWLMLKEHLTMRKIIGVLITISGVVLVLSVNAT
jgi:drug/metabolite transporter (DMT)-like permease